MNAEKLEAEELSVHWVLAYIVTVRFKTMQVFC